MVYILRSFDKILKQFLVSYATFPGYDNIMFSLYVKLTFCQMLWVLMPTEFWKNEHDIIRAYNKTTEDSDTCSSILVARTC